jgi:hypothetical protein
MSARNEQGGDFARPQMPKEMKAPAWVTEGYGTDAVGRRLAAWRYNQPHTTQAERDASREYVNGETWPCSSCGRHAFNEPGRVCYWCAKFGVRRDGVLAVATVVTIEHSTQPPGQPTMEDLRAKAKRAPRRKSK